MRKSLVGILFLAVFGFALTDCAEEATTAVTPEKAPIPCQEAKKCGLDKACHHNARPVECNMTPCHRFGGFHGMHDHCMMPGRQFGCFHGMPCHRFGGFHGMHDRCMMPGRQFGCFHEMPCHRFGGFHGMHKHGMKCGNRFGGFGTSVKRNENEIVYSVAMAGTPKDEVSVSTKGNMLFVDWKKTPADKDGKTRFENHRKFLLPKRTDQEKIKATYKDGLLSVIVPMEKEPENPAKAIQID